MSEPAAEPRLDGIFSVLVRGVLRRPVAVTMAALSLVVLGVIAYARIPVQLMPQGYTWPLIYVHVSWPSATPAEAVEQVLEPLEGAVATVPGVRKLNSRASVGSTGMRVEFDDSTDMDDAYNAVRDRIDRIRGDLPASVREVYVWKFDPEDEPVVVAGVVAPPGVTDAFERVDGRLLRRVDRMAGVGSVEIWGGAPRVVDVAIDAGRARAHGITPHAIAERVRRAGFVLAIGKVRAGGRVLPVRVDHAVDDVERLRALPLLGDLRLADVADVSPRPDEGSATETRIDGQPALMLGVYKESRANTVETCRSVRAALADAVASDPVLEGFTFQLLFDQGALISESISNLETALLGGGCIAVALLFLFLRRFRMTLIAATAIPASLLGTVAALYLLGRSLNLLSLVGLMLSVGMVVDNAIVVVERIARYRRAGTGAHQAALRGASEVGLAITVATATTIAAFLPLMLMSGNRGLRFFLGELGLPVCLSLAASLVIAVGVAPLLTRIGHARAARVEARAEEPAVTRSYGRLLSVAVRHPFDTVLLAAALFATIFLLDVPVTDRLDAGADEIAILFRMPSQLSMEERGDVLYGVERAVRAHAEELGIAHLVTRIQRSGGRDHVRAYLLPPGERALGRDEITKRLKEIIDPGPGVRWRIGWGRMSEGEGKSLAIQVRGPEAEVLLEIAEEAAARLRTVPGIIAVSADSDESSVQELRARLRPEVAQRSGATPALVGGSLSLALRGWTVDRMRLGYRDADVLVRVAGAREDGRAAISSLTVPVEAASPVPQSGGAPSGQTSLGAVASFTEAPGFGSIHRHDRESIVQLLATLEEEGIEQVRDRVSARLADLPLPRGYRIGFGDRFKELEEMKSDELFAAVLAIAFVFLLMGILFESWLLPLAVLASLPFAFVGATWALALTGTTRDVMAMVGMVILIGVVVNNAIVLVDAINRLRREGLTRTDAIVQAGRERLRPILMTALTTIGGLLPLALGTAQVAGVSYAPLARPVIGGLLTSTLVTLVLVPTAYALLDDLGGVLRRIVRAGVVGSRRSRE